MVEFSLFGIPVRVELSFWITIGLLGILSNQHNSSEMLVNAGLFVFAAFISILIHELGHALMIRKYRQPTQIVLSSFGGYATHPMGVLSRPQVFLMTLAGPLVQALSGLAVLYITQSLLVIPDNKMAVLVDYFIMVSIFWAILNCVPVLPLDGGRMLEAALGPRRIKITLMVSIGTAVLLGMWGISAGQPFIAVFMLMFAWQNYQAYSHYNQ